VSLSHYGSLALRSPHLEQDGTAVDCLLSALDRVTEQRKERERIHKLVFVLATSLVAVLAGATNVRQIADQIADFPQELLERLGGRWCHFHGRYRTPSEKTIRGSSALWTAITSMGSSVGGFAITRAVTMTGCSASRSTARSRAVSGLIRISSSLCSPP
jgi:predicted PurR-regulated permease PerM